MAVARAIVMLGPRSFELRELELPSQPRPGGALMRVLGNGICGSDWDVYSGAMANPAGRPAPFPMVPGHEPVGEIVAIDDAAAVAWGVAAGDTVVVESRVRCGSCPACLRGQGPQCRNAITYSLVPLDHGSGLFGGMAEYMELLPNTSVFKVPDGLGVEDAAIFNPLGNAMQWTLEAGQVGVGDRVLILGCGQRGLCCAVAAREAGASQVIVTGLGSTDAHKLALAPEFGADATIDVEREETVAAVAALTGGEGVDVVVDTVPASYGPIADAFEALRLGGTLVLAGVRGRNADDFPFDRIRGKALRVIGVAATTAWSVENALRIIASGRYPFARLHSHRFALEEAEQAVRTLGGEVGSDPLHITVMP
ncbi:MAG TPA: zinc-binding dehydrogenase [Solirubrobacterales bacterium]|nr:zinc-binding dehydrogenase [Solirubrobacterales bacterium]